MGSIWDLYGIYMGSIWDWDLYGIDMDLYGIRIYMGCIWDQTVNIYVYTVYV